MNRKCLNCGKELIGKQKKYCSVRCCNKYSEIKNKESRRKYKKEYRKKNRESIKEYNEQYNKENRERLIENKKINYRKNIDKIKKYNNDNKDRMKKYYEDNKERIKERVNDNYKNNRKKILKYVKEYGRRNRKKIMAYHKIWEQKQPLYKVGHSISGGIRNSLKSKNLSKNRRHWEDMVGYTIKELKEHLENLFQSGMTWDNYGKWHIDHIIPKVFFRFQDIDDVEFKYCWSLNNLQPLWAKDNFSKNSSIMNKYLRSE